MWVDALSVILGSEHSSTVLLKSFYVKSHFVSDQYSIVKLGDIEFIFEHHPHTYKVFIRNI